jgi:hypothetical protein
MDLNRRASGTLAKLLLALPFLQHNALSASWVESAVIVS